MTEPASADVLSLRLPLYAYTAPLWQGRRVLEIGCGDGSAAEYLAGHGAARVVAVDQDAARVDRARARHPRARAEFRILSDLRRPAAIADRFDVVLVPEGQAMLASPPVLTALRGLLAEGGFLVMAVPSSDRRSRASVKEGVGYYDLADTLAAQFPVVRMLGQTPFLGFGLVEFDGGADTLRVDVSLLHGTTEPPSHYIAVAGTKAPPALGYALVQIPFSPAEPLLGAAGQRALAEPVRIVELASEVARLTKQLETARASAERASAERSSGASGVHGAAAASAAETRVELAERRLDEAERRARSRVDEAENRLLDLRRKLDEAIGRSESAVRVSRTQAEEIDELRARLRRVSEDRASTETDMAKLRRALAEADESVLTLTRRTAEEIAVVAERLASGFGGSGVAAGVAGAAGGVGAVAISELEARARKAEEAAAREHAEVAALGARLRAAEQQARTLSQKSEGVAERDDRIARLEGDKQDLLWRVAELEQKLKNAEADVTSRASTGDEIAAARAGRDRAIEEFHRGAAEHMNELNQLQASVAEQAALVAELEDALAVAEARAAAADKDASSLRRNAKELEDADRARRGRLAELEGKLLRLERERADVAAKARARDGNGDGNGAAGDDAEVSARLQAAERRAVTAEQRALAAEERAAAATATTMAAAASAASAADAPATTTLPLPSNGTHAAARSAPDARAAAELAAAVEQIEARLREEMRALSNIEESLERARADAAHAASAVDPAVRAALEQALAAKDSQLVEGRLELARLRRDSEARQGQLEAEITELRMRLVPIGVDASESVDEGQAQLILMHSTLGNIRRRSARLRDELEGFRRRLDTLPPGALSSMLEEIGEDLAEFAK